MIQLVERNDLLDIAQLAVDTIEGDQFDCYRFDKLYNTQRLINAFVAQENGDKNVLVIKDVVDDKIAACLNAQAYHCSYSGDLVMNVDEIVVDYTLGQEQNRKSTIALIKSLEEYCKQSGIKHWRADSNHSPQMAKSYVHFLDKHFEGRFLYGFKGEVK